MTEITALNFDDKYDDIYNDINNSTFLSFDCEFSGLSNSNNENLFDSPNERYKKIRRGLSDFLILQFGLSCYKYDRDTNTFYNSQYSFYLFPYKSPVKNEEFRCEIGGMQFLRSMKFNWSKVFDEGLGFTSKDEEEKLLSLILEKELVSTIYESYWFEEKNSAEKLCAEVESLGTDTTLNLPTRDPFFIYYVSQRIRYNFPGLWTSVVGSNRLSITNVTPSLKEYLMSQETPEKIIQGFRGFSRVFNDIVQAQKPIVGHNCLKDLAMMYQQFVRPLPNRYEVFKDEIHKLFPCVYDTKSMSYCLKRKLPKYMDLDVGSLEDLFRYLHEGQGAKMMIFAAQVHLPAERKFHDAGFDAICAGACFIKLAYWFSVCSDDGRVIALKRPLPWSQVMASVIPCKNRVNIIRGPTDYLCLDGPDPPNKCSLLHVESKQPLDLVSLEKCIIQFGRVDLRRLSRHRVLLAVNTFIVADRIQQALQAQNLIVTRGIPIRYRFRKSSVLLVGVVAALLVTTIRFVSAVA